MSKSFDRLSLLSTFVRIAEEGSISAAARDLGISQPSASRQLVELESRLRTQLMLRSTHSLALTDAGSELLLDARALLEGWESLEEKHINFEKEVRGPLKIVAPVALGQIHLARMAAEFQLAHPNVKLSWQLDDSPIKFSEVGCDCWIKVGEVPDETLIVKPIGKAARRLVGAPSLAVDSGTLSIDTIKILPMISVQPFEGRTLPLTKDKITETLSLLPAMQTNNIFAAKEACLMGLGVAVMPIWLVNSELKDGTLVDLLPDWQAPTLSINLAYLPNKFKPLRLKLFIDYIAAQMQTVSGIVN